MNFNSTKRNAMLTPLVLVDSVTVGLVYVGDRKQTQAFGLTLVDVKKTIWMTLTGLVLSCPAIAASFDCTRAQTTVETLICADTALSKLDEEMANVYGDVLAYVIDPATLRIEQEQWLKVRNKSIDKEPLRQQYHERILALRTEKTITKNEPRYRYKLERGEDKALCSHMTQVFNDKFKTPWYKSWLKLESDPILFGLPYSKQFERLPGVAYDKHSTFDMLLAKYPTSPEFEAVKWQEGRYEPPTESVYKSQPILIAQLDFFNDGETEWIVKQGFFRNGDHSRVSEHDELSVYRAGTFNVTEKLPSGALYYGQKGKPRPKKLDTAMQLRPFVFAGTTYLSAYQAKGGTFDQNTFEGDPAQEYMNIWRLTGRSQRFYNQSTETLETVTICRIRMYRTN